MPRLLLWRIFLLPPRSCAWVIADYGSCTLSPFTNNIRWRKWTSTWFCSMDYIHYKAKLENPANSVVWLTITYRLLTSSIIFTSIDPQLILRNHIHCCMSPWRKESCSLSLFFMDLFFFFFFFFGKWRQAVLGVWGFVKSVLGVRTMKRHAWISFLSSNSWQMLLDVVRRVECEAKKILCRGSS